MKLRLFRLQRCSTVDNLRHPRDGHGISIQKRNSQLFSWDDEFWKRSVKGQQSLASSASTFEEVESLCWSKSSSDSMCSSQQQWNKFGGGGPLKGAQPSRRLISRQSSTTSTSTSRSSGMIGDASAGDASFDFNPDRCQLIADTLLESMDFLGAQGNLDMADTYYLEKIFKRVLEWNNRMSVPASKTASKDCGQVGDFKSSKSVLGKQERHLDANSPRSHAALRERLLQLKHIEKVNSRTQHREQTDSRASQQNSDPQSRRLRDLIVPDEDDADTDLRVHFHPFQSSGKRYGLKRETSHSSRDTLASSKAFSDNSTGKYSGVSSMSSISMDNGSLGGTSQHYSETQQISHQPSIATLLPQYSIQPTGSFESTASPSDHFLRSQACATSHAERVLMGLGFDAAEGFLPERFLKDWYSKIAKAQTESAVSAELKREESIKNPSANADIINERHSITLKDRSISRRSREECTDLPSANDQYTKLERLKEYIAAYTNNVSSIDEEKGMPARQSSFSRQKSLPLCLETLSKLERECRLSGMDPFDKEAKLQMFISDNKPHIRKNARSEHSPKGRQYQRAATGCASESLNADCRDHSGNKTTHTNLNTDSRDHSPNKTTHTNLNTDSREHSANKTTHTNLNTHLEQTIGSLQQIMHRQLVNGDLSDTSDDIHDNSGIHKQIHKLRDSPTNKQTDGASKRPSSNISNGNLCGARALRSPTRQIAIDVYDPVFKDDRSEKRDQAISEQFNGATSKVNYGKGQHVSDVHQRIPHKIESLASKDSEEVANIMENQPNRDITYSSVNQHQEKTNGEQGRPLKSALKHIEPAMVSIVLEDTDQGEGRCNADIVSVSHEGIHLVIPLSACNSSSLSPIPQSPVTVIEVGLDNQQDSLDTEGTYSSKDTEDDSFCHPTMFYAGEYSAMKPKHDRRRSLSSLCPHPEHPQRRRSTGIMSPIPCQLSLIQVPNSSKEGHSRRRLSLEVPVVPEIRHLLEKQKGLLTNQSKESMEEPKKIREKRRASFSEAEPTIINDVLARQRCPSPRYLDNVDSCPDNMTNQDISSSREDQAAGKTGTNVAIIGSNGSEEMLNVAYSEKNTPTSVGHEANNCSSNFERRVSEYNEHKDDALVHEAKVMLQCNNTKINVYAIQERDFGTTPSVDSSPRSAKSAFRMTRKRNVENNTLCGNGYFSETDAGEFPVSVNPNLTPRPISTIARYLEAVANSLEADTDSCMPHIVSTDTDRKSSPIMQFPDHNPLVNGTVNSLQQKVKAQMISRAVEVNNSTCPCNTQNTTDTSNQSYQSEYYYACDKSTQCTLTGSVYETPAHIMCRSISASTQTGVCKHEMSSQTTDVYSFVNNNNNVKKPTQGCKNTVSKGINTLVCLIGREHGNTCLKRPTNYTTSNFNNIDETIREIDAELSNIDIRNYQRSRGMHGVQLAERSYPSFPLDGLTDCMYQGVSSNNYEYQAQNHVTGERRHRLALTRCAPSNWYDATELVITSHSDGNKHGRTGVIRHRRRDNEHKIIVNGFNDGVNVSLLPGTAIIPSNVSTSTECFCTDTDVEEDTLAFIQHANKDLQSSRFSKYEESSPNDTYRLSVKSCNRGAGNSSTVENTDNKSKSVIEFINPFLLHTSTSLEANKENPSTRPQKPSNEARAENDIEQTTFNSKDTLKAMNLCCEKVIDTQSNVCVYDHKQEKQASSLDLSSARNASKRQKLINTKQMIRIDFSESTPLAHVFLGKDQIDKGHSKLSRLKYKQSSHRNSGSSLDVELDFMKAAEPIRMFKCPDPTSQVLQDCKQQIKKQKDAPDILDSALSDKVRKQARHISTRNIEALSHLDMSTNVSNTTRPVERSWPDSSSTSSETQRNRETSLGSRNITFAENIITGTDGIVCSLVADTVVSVENPVVSSISEIKLENASNDQSTRDTATTAIHRASSISLQVPSSPEHLFIRARHTSGSSTSSPTASSVTSSKTQTQENYTTWVEDNKMSVTQVADSNVGFTSRSTGVDVLLAVQEQKGIRDGCERKQILANASARAFNHLSSVEKSCDECSEVSIYPVLSNDSVFDGSHTENRVSNARREGYDAADLVTVKAANFHDITTFPPVFDFDVLNSNHKSQSSGVWRAGDEEMCDVDSNQSVAGSELYHDIDDIDVMEMDNRKRRSNSESSYSEPFLDLSDTLSLESDINENIKKNVNKSCLLTTGYNSDDLLQVSDIGGSTAFQRKSSGENLSLSPSNSTRGHERHRHSPSYTSVRSPSREFPPEPIQCNDSDDELDSETELKIRERLRQVRRESRRNSDNWEAIQSVLLSQNNAGDDSLTKQEETSHNELNQSDNATLLTNPLVSPSVEKSLPLDESSGDECDQEISRINICRPALRKLIKMSSDPVDKDMYCRSSPSFPAKEKASQRVQNSPVVEENMKDIENAGVSFNANTTGDGMGLALLCDTTVNLMPGNVEESLKQDVKVLGNNFKVCGKLEITNESEGSCSPINDTVDLITNGDNEQNNSSVARILEVEFINDDLEKDASVMIDRQDSLQEPSNNILDELEVIALFNKLDGYESSVNPYADYSSETSTSVEFKLSQISEEDTQSEDNTSDESRRHIWQVRSRFVLPQDTLESTLDGITRQDTVGSTSSYHSDNTESVALEEETTLSWSKAVTPIQESNFIMNTASDDKQMKEVTNDTTHELQYDGTHSNYFPTELDLSNKELSAEIEEVLSHPISYQMEHNQQENGFLYSEDFVTPNSHKSPGTVSHLNHCDNLKTNDCSSEESSVFCDVFPTVKADSGYETRILEWKTDITGQISTTITNTRVVKTIHLNSNQNNLCYTNAHINSAAEMSEDRHTASMEFLVGDHRRKKDTDNNQQQQLPDQLPDRNETDRQTVPNGKYNTGIEDTLAVNNSQQKVTNNTVEDLYNSEVNDTFSDARNNKKVNIEKDVASDLHHTNRTVLLQTHNQNNQCSGLNDLKNKVRAMFLIDSVATSKDTVEDNNIHDERGINRTQEDVKNKTLSTFIIDTSGIETASEVVIVDACSKDSDDSKVQHGLTYGKENSPTVDSIIHTESETWGSTKRDSAGTMSRKSKINVGVIQKALSSFFSETVDLEDSFEGNDELTDTDYRFSESSAQKQMDSNVSTSQLCFNSSSEVVLAGNINNNVGDCKSTISLPQSHLSDAISYVVPKHDVLYGHMSKETTSNNIESDNNMNSGNINLTRDISTPDDPCRVAEYESNLPVSKKVNRVNGINTNHVPLFLNKSEGSCDQNACEGNAGDILEDNSRTVSFGDCQATSSNEADVVDDIKQRVKAMFLLSRHSDSSSSDSIPLDNLASFRGPSPPFPTKLVYNPATSSSPPSPTIPVDNPAFYTGSSPGSPTKSVVHISSVFSDSRKQKTNVADDTKKRVRAMFLLTGHSDSSSSDSKSADNSAASREPSLLSPIIPVVDLPSPKGSSLASLTKPIVHVSTVFSDNTKQEMDVANDMKKRVRAMFLLTGHSDSSCSYSKSTENPASSRAPSPPSPTNSIDNPAPPRRPTSPSQTIPASSRVPSPPSPTKPVDNTASPRGSSSSSPTIPVDNPASYRGSSTRSSTKPIINSSPVFSNNIEKCTDVADIKKRVREMFLLTGHSDSSSSDSKSADNPVASRAPSPPFPTEPIPHVSSREPSPPFPTEPIPHVSSREPSPPFPTEPIPHVSSREPSPPFPTEPIPHVSSREPSPPFPTEPIPHVSSREPSPPFPTEPIPHVSSREPSPPSPIEPIPHVSSREPSPPSPIEPILHVSSVFSDNREQKIDVADDRKKRLRAMFLLTGHSDSSSSESKSTDNSATSREPSSPSPTKSTENTASHIRSSSHSPTKPVDNSASSTVPSPLSPTKSIDNPVLSRAPSTRSLTKHIVHVSSVFSDNREQDIDVADDMKKHVREMFLLTGQSDSSSSDSKSTDNPAASIVPSPLSPTKSIDNPVSSTVPSPPSPTKLIDNPTSPRRSSSSSPTIPVDNLTSSKGLSPRSQTIPEENPASSSAPPALSPTKPIVHVSSVFSGNREQRTDVAEEAKKRVRAMFLLTDQNVPSSSDSKSPVNLKSSREPMPQSPTNPIDNSVSSRESSPSSPIKPMVNGSTVFSDNNEHFPKSFVTSSAACGFSQKEDLNEQCESVNNNCVINSDIQMIANADLQILNKNLKITSSGVNRSTNKNLRVLKYRNSLLRLHEQMNVFSSIGSDSDSELTSALKNQGDYDIRMRDLALGRISSDNNDEEETGIFTESCKRPSLREGITTANVGASAIVQTAPNVPTKHGHHLEDSGSSGSCDTLVNSNSNSVEFDVNSNSNSVEFDVNSISNSVEFDVNGLSPGTDTISKSRSLEFDASGPASDLNAIAESRSFDFDVTDAATGENVIAKSEPINIDETGSSNRANDISKFRCLEIGSAPVTNDISTSRSLELRTTVSKPSTNSISESCSLEFDLTRSAPETQAISKSESMGMGVAVLTPATNEMSKSRYLAFEATVSSPDSNCILTPKVIVQQPSEEQLTLKPTKTNSASATMISNSYSEVSILSDAKENVNHNENRSDPGQRRHHFNKRFSARPGSSSPWLRKNPHANFLTPESALKHTVQYSHVANHSPYTRIEDDLHPELSYLDIVSKLKQQEVYKTKPTRQSEVEVVISPPEAKDRRSLKAVRFTLSENIPSAMSSEHTKDRTSTGTK